jgi:hypothetical protein
MVEEEEKKSGANRVFYANNPGTRIPFLLTRIPLGSSKHVTNLTASQGFSYPICLR